MKCNAKLLFVVLSSVCACGVSAQSSDRIGGDLARLVSERLGQAGLQRVSDVLSSADLLDELMAGLPPAASDEVGGLFGLFRSAAHVGGGEVPDELEACLYVDGSAGTPRFGGGGDILAPAGVTPVPAPVVPMTGQPAVIAVLDEFDFSGLFRGLARHEAEHFTWELAAPGSGADAEWSALLLYRFDIDPVLADLPHGHLVVFHMLELLKDNDELVRLSLPSPDGNALTSGPLAGAPLGFGLLTVGDVTVWLVPVNFDHVSSAADALRVLSGPEFAHATLNLSWNIIDCDFRDGYAASFASEATPFPHEVASVGEFFLKTAGGLLRQLGQTERETLCDAFGFPVVADDIGDCEAALAVAAMLDMHRLLLEKYQDVQLLETNLAGRPATAVGAAGNEGLPWAQPPASWSSVHGVAACAFDGIGAKAAFSSAASPKTILSGLPGLAPGAWFALPAPVSTTYGYWGTSFAAPHVALLEAMHAGASPSVTVDVTSTTCR